MKQELIISKIKTCPDDFGYHVEYPDNFSPIKSNLTPEENQTHFNLVIAEAIADSLSPNYQLCAELMNSNFSIKSEQIEGYQERLQMLLKICTEEIREEANIP
ncbi:MAG: hypothetical protein KC713_10800, partial [Candidatus Omnitrophica bacterium]|nr:hypothetical protein [Candidatus Omnitrophota bacterium]